MGDEETIGTHSDARGVVTGKHTESAPSQFLVAPSTSSEFNTGRLRLIPVACFRIDDVRFKFDSSFVLPDISIEMAAFDELRKSDPLVDGAPISIFGHADPSFKGNFELTSPTSQSGDDYNKTLSGRRAIAIYALLVRDTALWDNLFHNHLGHDVWGEDSIRIMLDATDAASGGGSSSSSAIQSSSGAAQNSRVRDIANDSGQRQQLYSKYMHLLCGDLKLDKGKDFLARGAGPDQKGDVQGCSRFNPVLLFSGEKEQRFKQAAEEKDKAGLEERNDDNSINRRVVILIFRKGSQVLPAKWPCPTYKEGPSGCKQRFFSDGDTRRSTHPHGVDRNFDKSHDTFACRFYQRISDGSPCEGIVPPGFTRLIIRLLDDDDVPRPGVHFVLRVSGLVFSGKTDSAGLITQFVPKDSTQGSLRFDEQDVTLNITPLPSVAAIAGLQLRLNNLGYDCGALTQSMNDKTQDAIREFQEVHHLAVDGQASPAMKQKLVEVYGH